MLCSLLIIDSHKERVLTLIFIYAENQTCVFLFQVGVDRLTGHGELLGQH